LHWVAARDALPAEIRLYNPLFTRPDPGAGGDLVADLNPHSLEILTQSRVEHALGAAVPGEAVQFERQGYFCADLDSTRNHLVFNRTVGLRDSWAKARASGG
jgi:glutaminyl-tRNA synthetase